MAPPYVLNANQAGYWEKPTSTIDWCEENYAATYYIAEFYNTVTNAVLIFPPLFGMIYYWRCGVELRYLAQFMALAVVGIGSWLFHMTLKYEMQVAYACLVFLFMYKTAEACRKFPKVTSYVLTSFMLFAIAFLIWNIDNAFCRYIRKARVEIHPLVSPLTQLHGWWHIFVGVSSWMHALITIYARCLSTGKPCTIKVFWHVYPYLEFHEKTE